jgi:hypothetical protein
MLFTDIEGSTALLGRLGDRYGEALSAHRTMAGMLGLLVVAIMLMGLISAISTGVFERARELGILFGWLVYQGLLALIRHEAALSLPGEFAPAVGLITPVGVLVLRLLAVRGSLCRATRMQPGTALWRR